MQFLERFESQSTINGYKKAFKKFDSFLLEEGFEEEKFFIKLVQYENADRYHLLQRIIDHIKKTVSPAVTRNYFDNLFMYFLLKGIELDYTQKKIRLKFPRISRQRFEGLEEKQVKDLLERGNDNFKAYMSALVSGGLREDEALRLTPSMIMFDEYPTRIKLPALITKFSIPRETFIGKLATERIKNIMFEKKVKENETIFVNPWHERSIIKFDKYFAVIRTKAGLDTPNRKPNQQNDITLHSFRSYFITVMTDNKLEAFGHALSGHTKYMDTYYRKSINERQKTYATVASLLNF